MKKYDPKRIYRFHKKRYKKFVLFVKKKNEYYTYDKDIILILYLYNNKNIVNELKLSYDSFNKVRNKLFNIGINIVICGWKKCNEIYSNALNIYDKLIGKSNIFYWSVINEK